MISSQENNLESKAPSLQSVNEAYQTALKHFRALYREFCMPAFHFPTWSYLGTASIVMFSYVALLVQVFDYVLKTAFHWQPVR